MGYILGEDPGPGKEMGLWGSVAEGNTTSQKQMSLTKSNLTR